MPPKNRSQVQASNAQLIVQSDDLRAKLDQATFSGHPEYVYRAENALRDGRSETSVLDDLTKALEADAAPTEPAPALAPELEANPNPDLNPAGDGGGDEGGNGADGDSGDNT